MAIQHRRGDYDNFDPSRLLPGEWAVVLSGDGGTADGMAAYICFAAGVVKRIETHEDMVTYLENLREDLLTAADAADDAAERAEEAIDAIEEIVELAVPLMSASTRGGAKLGSGLALTDGALGVQAITNAQVDSVAGGTSEAGPQSLSLSGLTRLWSKITGAFAALTHSHAASDITSGTLAVARGGTGASTAAAARTSLDAAQSEGAAGSLYDAEQAIADLSAATGNVPVATDGSLQSQVNTLRESVYLPNGTYLISPMVCPGYITGSGNYVDVTIPFGAQNATKAELTSATSVAVYTPSDRFMLADIDTSYISNVARCVNTFKFELKLKTTKTPNMPVIVLFEGCYIKLS